MKTVKISLLLLLCSVCALAQQKVVFKMAGTIYDEQGAVLTGANVYLT